MDEEKLPSPEQPIAERVKLYESEMKDLLIKYDLDVNIIPTFPQYNILPDHLKLALVVITKEGVQYRISYAEKKKEKAI